MSYERTCTLYSLARLCQKSKSYIEVEGLRVHDV